MSSALLHLLSYHFIPGILNKALILAHTLCQNMLYHYQLASSIMLEMEFSGKCLYQWATLGHCGWYLR